ncbi:hypothetical protein M408DRAFT_325853 [Serendipita vermifera MAFF 305830]|uniref:Uncharacterized protein n=1 Tax=Serendipita vermifera MAFF 305830 TaxID=933852 RepID=A0A0C3BCA1_SERVB|nr:hypothetical protein M408DRAFT_325853 [Serendipita vermifera MAFF 305830]
MGVHGGIILANIRHSEEIVVGKKLVCQSLPLLGTLFGRTGYLTVSQPILTCSWNPTRARSHCPFH